MLHDIDAYSLEINETFLSGITL